MLHSIKRLIGFTIGATDGEIGKVKDFFFDDETWTVRYLVVETGSWLFGRKILIPPMAFQMPDWDSEVFHVNLTRDQVKNSPDIDTEKPVSRQQEIDLYGHYSWPFYGHTGYGAILPLGTISPGFPSDETVADDLGRAEYMAEDQHLRSIKDVSDYKIHATDGDIGEVADFLIDDTLWEIPFLVLETGNWFTGKQILIPVKSINNIDLASSSVYVNQTIEALRNSPEFENDIPVNEGFERIKYHYRADASSS